jgi:malonate transporter and related proteins
MLPIFESILPIFLLVVTGNLLRRTPLLDAAGWAGIERLGYWFLYPALLFVTIVNADFSGLRLDALMAALMIAVFAMAAFTFALWPLLGCVGIAAESEFSSIFQTALRWNGFMAFAIAEKVFPPAGLVVVALAMAIVIVPINLASVYVVTRFADRSADWPKILRAMATNPLILAALAAILMRFQPFGLYEPLNETLDLVGRASLGMGLVAIGAGLKPAHLFQLRFAIWLPVVLKLIAFPALLLGLALALGVRGPELEYLALCAAVPTAMNGYLLARQLGGDAELYAAVTTLQTAISFLTIPAVLLLAAQLASA